MNQALSKADVVIAGGGPVGLCLAGLLGSRKYRVIVLEKKDTIDRHSKSLGIHPISMELFDEIGIADRFFENGIMIRKGIACIDRKKVGTVDFESSCPEPYNFILALPQYQTEQILQEWIQEIETVELIRDAEVTGIRESDECVTVVFDHENSVQEIKCMYLAGCDGKNSFVRQKAGIKFPGKTYPDTYLMGDFSDNTGLGNDAAVFLHKNGLIESFPLPDDNRRWVVKTDSYIQSPNRDMLEALVLLRLDHNLHQLHNSMISSFGVQHFLAEKFHSGRMVLAGDSAHIVSPIGGQGMNLGWLTARRLAAALCICLEKPDQASQVLNTFTKTSRKTAKKVARRAELNTWLGRERRYPFLRNLMARLMVKTPLRKKMARMFTMRGL